MPINPSAPETWFTTAVVRYLTAYYEEEGHFGALSITHPDQIPEMVERFAGMLGTAAMTYQMFEAGEPSTEFNDPARRALGLGGSIGLDAESDSDPERTARIRDAARLELRLEDLAFEIMHSGLGRAMLAPREETADAAPHWELIGPGRRGPFNGQ